MYSLVVDPHELDAYLDQVLIGGREKRLIVLAEYDPGWPARFALERSRIAGALGSIALGIEHIGSTAVPGLAAKPIIDILVTVADPYDDGAFVPALERAGYRLRVREPAHRMLRTPECDVHVHVLREDDPEVDRHLRFRDRLRRSSADRDAYERLKRELAARDWPDTNHYAEAKGPFIDSVLAKSGAPARPARPGWPGNG
jgi:GrpB-like predicted nucleotidyltransferase (UPF0157 family)